MIRLLQSTWMVSVTGGVLYLATTGALLSPAKFEALRTLAEAKRSANTDPSWQFRNPEFSQWVEEIKREKEALLLREQQLREFQTRLEAERQELAFVTQAVHQVQAEFDRNVIRIQEQEVENVKRQAKVLSGMTPEGAAGMLTQMADEDIVRLFAVMKLEDVSLLLELLSKQGKEEAKRAATITDLMRRALPPAKPAGRATPGS